MQNVLKQVKPFLDRPESCVAFCVCPELAAFFLSFPIEPAFGIEELEVHAAVADWGGIYDIDLVVLLRSTIADVHISIGIFS